MNMSQIRVLFLLLFLVSKPRSNFGNSTSKLSKNITIQVTSCASPIENCIVNFTGSDLVKNACEISFIDQDIEIFETGLLKNLRNLLKLSIVNSTKVLMPKFLTKAPNIVSIRIVSNQLEYITEGLFNNLPVKYLWLSRNNIIGISPTAFDNMTNLEVLDLSNNFIRNIEGGWFRNTPSLYQIDLTNNTIMTLGHDAFKNLLGNQDYVILLGSNRISSIHVGVFKNLRRIKNLQLQNNEINSIPVEFMQDASYIAHLDLSNNNIDCPVDNIDYLKGVKNLYLRGNKLSCNCERKLKDFVLRNNYNFVVFDFGDFCYNSW